MYEGKTVEADKMCSKKRKLSLGRQQQKKRVICTDRKTEAIRELVKQTENLL